MLGWIAEIKICLREQNEVFMRQTNKINEARAYLFHGNKTILAFISSSYKLTSPLSSSASGNALLLRVVRTQIRIKKAWEMKVEWKSGSIKNDLPTYKMICACYETLKRMSLKLNVLFSFFYTLKWVCIHSFRWQHGEKVGRRNKQIIPIKPQVRALIRVSFQQNVQGRLFVNLIGFVKERTHVMDWRGKVVLEEHFFSAYKTH